MKMPKWTKLAEFDFLQFFFLNKSKKENGGEKTKSESHVIFEEHLRCAIARFDIFRFEIR